MNDLENIRKILQYRGKHDLVGLTLNSLKMKKRLLEKKNEMKRPLENVKINP